MRWFNKSEKQIEKRKQAAEWYVNKHGADVTETDEKGNVWRYLNGNIAYLRTVEGTQVWYDESGKVTKHDSHIKLLDGCGEALIGGACIGVLLGIIGLFINN